MEWPLVDPNDDGIRPAGKPDECFYCKQKIGEPHGKECVVVTKKWKVRFAYEITVNLPHSWDADRVFAYYNLGSWCADNGVNTIQNFRDELHGCLCGHFDAAVVGVEDETPHRELREPTE